MSPTRPDLSAEDILAALNHQGVRYVVIGAFAAIAQGAPIDATYDVDVTPQRDPENLQRLSLAPGRARCPYPCRRSRRRLALCP